MKQSAIEALDSKVESPPHVGAWIETLEYIAKLNTHNVAPPRGGVD